jgi:predicted nucleic acid-binding protein
VTGFMLDTNVFNRALAGEIPPSAFSGRPIFTTHIQRNELENTPDNDKRERLLETFKAFDPTNVPTSSFVFDVSEWDMACWSDDDGVWEAILARIKELDRAAGKRPLPLNQERDATVAETAIKLRLTLLTNDRTLSAVVGEFGGKALGLDALLSR